MLKYLSSSRFPLANRSSAYRIAVIYLVLSVVWILVSDWLVARLVPDPNLLNTLSTLKGWGFVAVTTWLIYTLIRRDMAALHDSAEQYRTLVEAADDAILLTDLQGHHLFTNTAYYTSLGYAPGEDENLNGFSIVHPDDAPRIKGKMQELLKQGRLTTEYRVRHKNGQWVDRFAKSTTIYDAQHQPVSILAIVRDVTDRRQAEAQREAALQALRDSEAKFRSYIEYAPLGVLVIDPAGRLVEANSASTQLLGYSLSAFKGMTFFEIIAPQSDEIGHRYYQTLEKQGSIRGELALRRRDGGLCWTVISAVKVANSGFMAYLLDITDRKQAEAERAQLVERLDLATRSAHLGIWDWNIQKNELVWDAQMYQLYGLQRDEFPGAYEAWLNGVYPEDRALSNEVSRQAVVGEREYDTEFRVLWPDGSVHWLRAQGQVFRDEQQTPVRMVGVNYDITERKQAEQALRESEARLNGIVRSAMDAIISVTTDQHIVLFNAAAEQMFRCSAAAAIGQPLERFIPERFRAAHRQHIRHFSDTGITSRSMGDLMSLSAVRADGEIFPIEASISQMEMNGDKLFTVILRDITQRQRNEESLRASEERYRNLVENMNDVVLELDAQGNLCYASANYEALSGYALQEELGRPAWQHVHPDDVALIQEKFKEGLAVEQHHLVYRVQHRNGTWLWIETSGKPYRAADGSQRIISMARDVTERKRAEDALRQSESLLAEAQRIGHIGHLEWTTPGHILHCSDELYRILDLPLGTALSQQTLMAMMTPEERARLQTLDKEFLAQRANVDYEYQIQRADGRQRWLHQQGQITYDEAGQPVRMLAIIQDITERLQAEEKLRESEERFRTAFDAMLEGAQIIGFDWRYLYINAAAERHNRRPTAELMGNRYMDMWPGIEETHIFSMIKNCLEEGVGCRLENEFVFPDGTSGWFELSIQPVPEGVFILSIDITERKRAEEEIRQLNATLEQRVGERTAELSDLYNNAPCGYHSLDDAGVFVHINDTELQWLGYTRGEIVGKMQAVALFTPASVEVFKMNFPALKASGRLQDLDLEMIRKDGSILPVLLSATAIYDPAGHFLMSRSTMIDHTERKRIEAQRQAALEALQQSQTRLEAANKELEAFAYSISHDLRAPLRAIDGFSRIILEDYAAHLDDEGRRLFKIVRDNTQKMDQLITDLLALSRISRSSLTTLHFDMTALVHDVYRTIASPEDLSHSTLTVIPLLEASGDPALLRQVWANLLSNALKYTRRRIERRIEVGSYTQGREQIYYVKDNGVGFNPDYAHKLFGIFQRLHSANEFEGTGVGLAIVQRIVARHGGRVWAEAQPDQGATFYFSLPVGEATHE